MIYFQNCIRQGINISIQYINLKSETPTTLQETTDIHKPIEKERLEEIETLMKDLEKYKGSTDLKMKEFKHKVDELSRVLDELEVTYHDDKDTMIIIQGYKDELIKLDDEVFESSKTEAGNASKVTEKERGFVSDANFSETELKEKHGVLEKYKYSSEKFASKEAYIDFLASSLTSVEEINRFVKYMYGYTLSKDEGLQQNYLNTSATTDDNWQIPQEMATHYNEKGHFDGDCDDLALFFEEILSKQGKNPFMFMVPGHAITAWFEQQADGIFSVYTVDTTAINDHQKAGCRELKGEKGETQEKLFSRLVNSFIKTSDSKSELSIDSINLGFLLPDGRAFNVPSNFSLTEKYQELKEALKNNDLNYAYEILKEESSKDPDNINIHIAILEFGVLIGEKNLEIEVGEITRLIKNRSGDKMICDNINQLCYFLLEKNFKAESCQLMKSFLDVKNSNFFDLNMNDTLSDLYVSDGNYQDAYQNDLKIFSEIKTQKIDFEKLYGQSAPIHFYLIHGVMDISTFYKSIANRIKINEKYKQFILSQKPAQDFLSILS